MIKAGLHCQDNKKMCAEGVMDCEGRPVLKKIGFLMDHMGKNCSCHYYPGTDIAYNEISCQMSGRSVFKKQLRHKHIGAGIQVWAMAESDYHKQYLYNFKLDRNDQEVNKVQDALIRLTKLPPPCSKNYRIAADNLFNSVDSCRQVQSTGHHIYCTMRLDRGVPDKLKEQMTKLKEKGACCFVQSLQDDLLMWVWVDSKPVVCISNVHPAAVVTAERLMKGQAVQWMGPCPLQMEEYNGWMGAIDDFDHLMSFHTCKLCSVKWWHTIFYFLVNVESINSLHLWRTANPPQDREGQLPLRIWIAGLINEILQ
eukprot:1348314-Rhodomonas_salina.1